MGNLSRGDVGAKTDTGAIVSDGFCLLDRSVRQGVD